MKYQQEKGVMFCPKFRQSEVGVRKKNKHWISGAPNEISATKRRCHALLKIPWQSWHFFCQSSPHFLTSTRQSILKLCFVNGHWSASKWLQTVQPVAASQPVIPVVTLTAQSFSLLLLPAKQLVIPVVTLTSCCRLTAIYFFGNPEGHLEVFKIL